MDVTKILAELKAERAQLEEAIITLEKLAIGQGKRRGRPPAWMSSSPAASATVAGVAPAPKRRGRPPGSKNKVRAAGAGEAEDAGESNDSGEPGVAVA